MAKRKLSINDLYEFSLFSHPLISPNGQFVLYEKTEMRQIENDYETQLWLANISGKSTRQLTIHGSQNEAATWSPDGKSIAYLSNNAFGKQLWMLSIDDGNPTRLTQFKYPLSSIVFSPDGNTIYGLLPIKDHIEVSENEFTDDRIQKRVYESLYYKFDGIGFHDGTRKQLIKVNIDSKQYQLLTDGINIEEFTLSPDGQRIAYVTVDREDDNPLYNGALYELDLQTGLSKQLYKAPNVGKVSYSPNGDSLAFIAGGLHKRLYIITSEDRHVTCLSQNYPDSLSDSIYTDLSFRNSSWKTAWSDDGKSIYVLSGHQGANEIVTFSVNQNEPPLTVIGGPRAITDFSYDGKSTIIATYTAPTIPSQLSAFSVTVDEVITRTMRLPTDDLTKETAFFPKQELSLDDTNERYLAEVEVAPLDIFHYESVDGWKMHGFMLKPADMKQGEVYPVVLDIHGGPHSTHGYAYFHQMQVLCAAGYAVVYVNPRGSSAYGETFTKAVINDYGGKDKQDILNGLEEALARYPFLDDTRMVVSGLSYGGFMTNLIITETNRFKAAISEGGVSNWVSIYGTGDVDPGMTDEDLPDKHDVKSLWHISPLAYVDQVNTPILIIHAEEDHRVPIEQSEQFYTYIKSQGKDARLVIFPESSHLMLQIGSPDRKVARLEEMIAWLKRYV